MVLCGHELDSSAKGVSEEDWYWAYSSTLNNRAPLGRVHSMLVVTDQVRLGTQSVCVGSVCTQPIRALIFKVEGKAQY